MLVVLVEKKTGRVGGNTTTGQVVETGGTEQKVAAIEIDFGCGWKPNSRIVWVDDWTGVVGLDAKKGGKGGDTRVATTATRLTAVTLVALARVAAASL